MTTRDHARAFMPYPDAAVAHAAAGPLAGLTFAVKDLFDVAGYPTSGGQPFVLAMSGIKTDDRADGAAPARRRRALRRQDDHRRAGVLDERPERALRLAGQRRRARAHQRRLVVGLGLGGVERALRLRPRQRHRRLGARAGEPLRPRRPQADARPDQPRRRARPRAEPRHLRLVRARRADLRPRRRRAARRRSGAAAGERVRLLAPTDVWGLLAPEVLEAQAGPRARVEAVLGAAAPVEVGARRLRHDVLELSLPAGARGLAHRRRPDRALRAAARAGREGALRLGARGDAMRRSTRRRAFRARFRAHLAALLGNDGVLLMPTMPDVAPLVSADEAGLEDYRNRATRMLCIAGLAGFPQLSLPLGSAPRRAARHLAARAGRQRPQPGAAGRAVGVRGRADGAETGPGPGSLLTLPRSAANVCLTVGSDPSPHRPEWVLAKAEKQHEDPRIRCPGQPAAPAPVSRRARRPAPGRPVGPARMRRRRRRRPAAAAGTTTACTTPGALSSAPRLPERRGGGRGPGRRGAVPAGGLAARTLLGGFGVVTGGTASDAPDLRRSAARDPLHRRRPAAAVRLRRRRPAADLGAQHGHGADRVRHRQRGHRGRDQPGAGSPASMRATPPPCSPT